MRRPRLDSYEPPDETPDETSLVVSWLVFGGFLAVLAVSIWAGLRWSPMLGPMDFSHDFYPDPSTERRDDETNDR
jgi:hypothetical protein